MVGKILHVLNREISGLHEAAYLLGFFTLLSQTLGFLRDRILAHTFGASVELDMYYSAFRIPDLIFVSVASIVSVSVLVPFIIERLEKSELEIRRFLDSIFSFFFLFIIVVSAAVFIATPWLLHMIFPGIANSENGSMFILMTRIMLISPILLGFSNLFASIAQAKHRFVSYALSPIFYNIGIIVGVIFFYNRLGIVGLALGVVLGSFLHFACQLFSIRKPIPSFRLFLDFGIIKNVIGLSFYRTLALSGSQISTLILIAIAARLSSGSVAIFNFAWNLQSVPLSLFGVSYTVALFPTISRLFGAGKRQKFLEEMTIAVRHITFWSVPVIVLFIVLRAQIVRTVLGSGNFDWTDTRLTAAALAIFSVSILAQSLILLFVRGYYAGGNTKKPLIINFLSAVLVVVFSFGFLKLFRESDFFRYFVESLFRVSEIVGNEVLMLPLGFSVAMIINASIFWFYFARRSPNFSPQANKTFFEVFSASVIMGFISYKLLNVFDNIFNINTLSGIFLQGFISGIIGIVAGVTVLVLLKNKEIKEVWATLHHKIWKAKVIVPEQESL
ncbi:MAG: murein biosynthesis integral membrane protein MurJ [Candidatus Taylorbacteria bacterium RIFCSPHIGHO2_01_FULL_45_63]|uniref:Murein biosynthesis integral membrane protein MurJ n=1 Tax=Candidatus Taylorbacteria bacterium RIFCSPHIGHO2_02_FULL_45_35 TaxID=1802311 RepID=A0A1G2MVS2_9BACT|nr:MAG: murein biosynthesis integral membrane protein MurJ [Candidatus Taylorbacteria bacterium RIFCSPHIGHO2_01_FULL_45_63]OHA27935.1 MAG: murein biosynthesis integral membrane protein MurJ [Candidatus Taylorbacteria bacterium RIFCSPHIGHO2_02_FULL_45_35]OHA34844.1 MAG: murein biosynthesis integral membrane protein MurJ [Candidatus Taylorbacteria bacterium RIFCSPLOWO2_01_FULL_45_34b]